MAITARPRPVFCVFGVIKLRTFYFKFTEQSSRKKLAVGGFEPEKVRLLYHAPNKLPDLWKGVKIVEAEICPDHVHMLVEIPSKMSVSSFMGYLKGKSSTMLYEQFGELKYKYRNREFWCKGHYVDTVGKNESRIAEYIQNQLKEDLLGEQLSIPEADPFTGVK